MIDALIAGRLYGSAQARTAANGKQFATAKVRVATREEPPFFAGSFGASGSHRVPRRTPAQGDDGRSRVNRPGQAAT
jgi:hypothetical protein